MTEFENAVRKHSEQNSISYEQALKIFSNNEIVENEETETKEDTHTLNKVIVPKSYIIVPIITTILTLVAFFLVFIFQWFAPIFDGTSWAQENSRNTMISIFTIIITPFIICSGSGFILSYFVKPVGEWEKTAISSIIGTSFTVMLIFIMKITITINMVVLGAFTAVFTSGVIIGFFLLGVFLRNLLKNKAI